MRVRYVLFFEKVVSCKIRCTGFITEVVRGFLYPKYFVRTSSGFTKFGTFSFMLWCEETKKNESLKVGNTTLECQCIFSKGRQKLSTKKGIGGSSQFLHPKETARTLASQ